MAFPCLQKRGRLSPDQKGESHCPYLPVPLSPGVENPCIFSKATSGKLQDGEWHPQAPPRDKRLTPSGQTPREPGSSTHREWEGSTPGSQPVSGISVRSHEPRFLYHPLMSPRSVTLKWGLGVGGRRQYRSPDRLHLTHVPENVCGRIHQRWGARHRC